MATAASALIIGLISTSPGSDLHLYGFLPAKTSTFNRRGRRERQKEGENLNLNLNLNLKTNTFNRGGRRDRREEQNDGLEARIPYR